MNKNLISQRSMVLVERQGEVKGAALAQTTFCPDLAAVLLHNLFTNSQPQARSTLLARIRYIHLLELFKNDIQLFHRNTAALILDGEEDVGGKMGEGGEDGGSIFSALSPLSPPSTKPYDREQKT